jgi:hypothetical protein
LTNGSLVALSRSLDTCPTARSLCWADRPTWAKWFLRFARRFSRTLDERLARCTQRLALRANFPVAACNPQAAPVVCSPRRLSGRRVPSGHRAAPLLGVPTCASCSQHRRCARPADFPVAACHLLAAPPVCSPRQLSYSCVPSAHRAARPLAALSVLSAHTLLSPRRPLAQLPSAM